MGVRDVGVSVMGAGACARCRIVETTMQDMCSWRMHSEVLVGGAHVMVEVYDVRYQDVRRRRGARWITRTPMGSPDVDAVGMGEVPDAPYQDVGTARWAKRRSRMCSGNQDNGVRGMGEACDARWQDALLVPRAPYTWRTYLGPLDNDAVVMAGDTVAQCPHAPTRRRGECVEKEI